MPTADRLIPFGTTVFARITARAVAAGAVNLGQGFPDFDGPDFVKDAAARALHDHPNQYAPMPGLPALRRALADRWRADTGLTADPDTEITVTAGCTEAIAACALGLLNPGDELLTFEPFYDAYPAAAALAGATLRTVPLRMKPDGSFAFDAAELAAAVTPRTRAILVNTPHNPTGKVCSAAELAQIAAVCEHHNLLAITDEVYERLVYRGEHTRLATLPGMRARTITLGSLGKSFSLTGWKIGWAIAPPGLTAAVRAAHQFLTFAVATPLQHAAAVAVACDDSQHTQQASLFCARRDRLAAPLRALGFRFADPDGGYFILADHSAVSARMRCADDEELCAALIDRAGVATIPPSAFYERKALGRSQLRFAFCKTEATIDEAVRRLRALLG